MQQTQYLIVGASHAALAAVQAIRMHDPVGSVTVVSKDDALPYSPTVLPYVVSGRSAPDRVFLRDEKYFADHRVNYLKGTAVTGVAAASKRVSLASGEEIAYDKLLLATGAAPLLPPVPGLESVNFHVLRTLDDAVKLRQALGEARHAVVLGAGLVGMHAAENLAKAGARVTVVEMQPRVLAGYFDQDAAAIIEAVFAAKGVTLKLANKVVKLAPHGRDGASVTLADAQQLDADLLLVSAGVAPVMDFLNGSGARTDRGILVDDSMHTSAADIWAAGDVAQARDFFGAPDADDGGKIINGILPDAVEQGKIAGMAMAGDPALKRYPGGVPLNTYTFFGQQAISVGSQTQGKVAALEVNAAQRRYLKIVMQDNRLTGIFGINVAFDPGVMWELILRRIDLAPVREQFVADPQRAARLLMSRTWR